MELSPIIISFQTAMLSIVLTFFSGTLIAYFVFRLKNHGLKILFNSLFTLPLVLPPTVFGFFLLDIFGVQQPIGKFLLDFFAVKVVFSWTATVIAAVAVSFPLMYRSAIAAFEQIEPDLFAAAQTLGFSEKKIFFKIALPLALNGLLAGGVLAFARGLGEFGATTMLAGNIAGKTRTLPLAIYSAVAAGDWSLAQNYVTVIVVICLLMLFLTELFSRNARRRQL
ncbi:molybdenum ABC transporter permease subunit [Enterococcus ureilyticus]|uniref:Molybdenum transport system permease n=1 Tax=Enterococcus ureilyticus TaxID=1131292 RepID=A0A1E5HDX1_9ENTE|nr:molybdate ABC transporter permease subunit [Enterococcus ureilyticus]MBM7689949.1 molybdate transport system permease protein [Enterococcus ureilyticus]MBO0446347.1 molybdate ABC transporter permease subunit [Enterococcus ureilyticus]OEG23046.1 molybdenum ABC transporter permease subunit [Enterococcus ureilyticus]